MDGLNDDVLLLIAEQTTDIFSLAKTCKHLYRLLFQNRANLARILCKQKGAATVASDIHARCLGGGQQWKNCDYHLTLALLKRPDVLACLSDNQKLDIAANCIQHSLTLPVLRQDITMWSELLLPKSVAVVGSNDLIRMFCGQEFGRLRTLIEGGARLRIPDDVVSTSGMVWELGSVDIHGLAWALCNVGPKRPLSLLEMTWSTHPDPDMLQVFMEHYRYMDVWKNDRASAHALRKRYRSMATETGIPDLLRSYDPFVHAPIQDLVERLRECIRTGSDDCMEEMSDILRHLQRPIDDLVDRVFICDNLKASMCEKMTIFLVWTVLPFLMTPEGEEFMQGLAESSIGTGNWHIFYLAHRHIANFLNPESVNAI